MADGVENLNIVLSIGFLNKKIEENLQAYKVKLAYISVIYGPV